MNQGNMVLIGLGSADLEEQHPVYQREGFWNCFGGFFPLTSERLLIFRGFSMVRERLAI